MFHGSLLFNKYHSYMNVLLRNLIKNHSNEWVFIQLIIIYLSNYFIIVHLLLLPGSMRTLKHQHQLFEPAATELMLDPPGFSIIKICVRCRCTSFGSTFSCSVIKDLTTVNESPEGTTTWMFEKLSSPDKKWANISSVI